MRFGVLGPLTVWTTDEAVVQVPELKVRTLLCALLLDPGRPVSTDRLAEHLWGDEPPGNPTGALQRKVWQLRRALNEAEPGARELIVSSPAGYALRAPADAIDASRFSRLTEQAQASDDPRGRTATLRDALALWRGQAFADVADAEFAQAAIARLEEQRLAALEAYAEARLELGEHTAVLAELSDLVAQHPLRERLRAAHIQALYAAGRQTEALDSYHDLRRRLDTELGLDPSPRLAQLQQAILEHDPSLGTESPQPTAAQADSTPSTNLPTALTELVGRGDAVDTVRDLLGSSRLVSLTGPGGVGKTRLALETAHQLRAEFSDGVRLVELTGHEWPTPTNAERSAAQLVESVAAALDVRDDTAPSLPRREPGSLLDRVIAAVRSKQLLLLLDNCEHHIDAVAHLVMPLLGDAPHVRVLATSQQPLGLPGEHVWPVPSLDVPPADTGDPAEVAGFPAVRLFVERAAATAPGFTLDDANASAVATLVRRLDGIPLAIELAAGRVRALGTHALLDRLDDRFRLLATGSRGVPARQQTLRSMIDWSWQLLSEPEQVVLRRLAVHADGCTLEAAEALCSGDDVHTDDVPDLLSRLVERSLVLVADGPDGPRYRLLESVAAYCTERLTEAGEIHRWCVRHSEYYAAVAEQADPELRGRNQLRWLRRLDAEIANIQRALDNAVEREDAASALRITTATTWYWWLRGRLQEGRRSLETALSVPGDAPHRLRTVATAASAALSASLGEPAHAARDQQARKLYERLDDDADRAHVAWMLVLANPTSPGAEQLTAEAMAYYTAVRDQWGIAAVLNVRAWQALDRGDLPEVRGNAERGLAMFTELGDAWGQLRAIYPLGSIASMLGDYDEAYRLCASGLRIAEELGLHGEVPHNTGMLGRIAMLKGDYDEAERLHRQASALAVRQGDPPAQHFADVGLALTLRRRGQLDEAADRLHRWLEWNERTNWASGTELVLCELGFIAEHRGEPDEALELHRRALAYARKTTDPRAIALALEGVASACVARGDPELGAQLLGAATAAREAVDVPLPPAERGDVNRAEAGARAVSGDSAFAAAFDQGRTWSLDEAAAHAMQST